MRRRSVLDSIASLALASVLVLGLAAVPVSAQLADLTDDLDLTVRAGSGAPDDLQALGDLVLFRADGAEAGREPWVSDGTPEGTRQLAETCPDICEGDPIFVANDGETAFFLAGSSTTSRPPALWATDGTPDGTVEVTRDHGPLFLPQYSEDFFPWIEPEYRFLGDTLYFFAGRLDVEQNVETIELWKSDGTPQGTGPAGIGVTGSFQSGLLRVVNERLFFVANSSGNPNASSLWSTDGTAAGTRELLMLPPGRITPRDAAVAGTPGAERYVFLFDTSSRLILGYSDGTSGGSALFETSSQVEIVYRWLAPLENPEGSRVYFVARTPRDGAELWRTDGTAAGTAAATRFTDPEPFDESFDDFRPAQVGAVPGRPGAVVLLEEPNGWSVYGTNGNPASTALVGRVCTDGGCYAFPRLAVADGSLVVGSNNGRRGRLGFVRGHGRGQLDLYPLPCDAGAGRCEIDDLGSRSGASTYALVTVENRPDVYFWFPRPLQGTERSQLWATDGTAGGTRPISAFTEPVSPPVPGRRPVAADARGRVFFSTGIDTFPGTRPEPGALWLDGGAADEDRLLAQFQRSIEDFSPGEFAALGGVLLASHCAADGRETGGAITRTAGDPATTAVLTELDTECLADGKTFLTAAETFAVFERRTGGFERELWRTDGTAAGTVSILRYHPNDLRVDETTFTALGDRVYFAAESAEEGATNPELWSTDGTSAGTGRDVDLGALGIEEVQQLTAEAGRLYLGVVEVRTNNLRPISLWESDGTQAGTRKVAILPQTEDFRLSRLEVENVNGDLYFLAGNPSSPGVYLATEDDLQAQRILLLQATNRDRAPRLVTYLGDVYLFSRASSPLSLAAPALWRLNTETREAEVVALFALDFFAFAPDDGAYLTEHGGLLYFAASDGEHGTELWRSDGTEAGTRMVVDTSPGARGSNPRDMTSTSEGLVFSAYHPAVGRELWRTENGGIDARLVHDINPGPASASPGPFLELGRVLYLGADDGYRGREIWRLDLSEPAGACVASGRELCLRGTEYRAILGWFDRDGTSAQGFTRELTSDTGAFYYRNPANLETVVKVLDGRPINEHYWTFLASLSSLEYVLDVTHAPSGASRRYRNPRGNFASLGDTFAFGPKGTPLDLHAALASLDPGAPSAAGTEASYEVNLAEAAPILGAAYSERKIAPRTCAPSAERLCLQGGRFAVEVSWRDFRDRTGAGTAVPLTADTGYFWFFDDANVELILKVLDGTDLNGNFWVFYGALSNVEYTITVTDTEEGIERTYFNPLRSFASVGDTGAFPQ